MKYVIDTDINNPTVIVIGGKVPQDVEMLRYEGFEPLTAEYVNEHFPQIAEEAYDKGYEDGCATSFKPVSDSEYQKGLEDAWELAKMIAYASMHGGVVSLCPDLYVEDFHSCADTFEAFTVHEALAKLKAYEQKKARDQEIKIGDEVEAFSGKAVVIDKFMEDGVEICRYFYPCKNEINRDKSKSLKKTGKHYDIADLLKKMKEGAE